MATQRSRELTRSRYKAKREEPAAEAQRKARNTRGAVDLRHIYPDLDDKYRQPNGAPTWEQWPGEPEVDFYFFQVYRDMGTHRTLVQARIIALGMTADEARELKKADPDGFKKLRSKTVSGCCGRRARHRWGWEERVTLFDEWQYKKYSDRVDDPELAKKMQLISLEEIREKAVTALKAVPVHRLPAALALTMVESAHRMERVVRGEPTDISKTVEDNQLDFSALNDTELQTLLGLIEKAGGSSPPSGQGAPKKKAR